MQTVYVHVACQSQMERLGVGFQSFRTRVYNKPYVTELYTYYTDFNTKHVFDFVFYVFPLLFQSGSPQRLQRRPVYFKDDTRTSQVCWVSLWYRRTHVVKISSVKITQIYTNKRMVSLSERATLNKNHAKKN